MNDKTSEDHDKMPASGNDKHGPSSDEQQSPEAGEKPSRPREFGGRSGPEPTRYGDWELNGRCIDF